MLKRGSFKKRNGLFIAGGSIPSSGPQGRFQSMSFNTKVPMAPNGSDAPMLSKHRKAFKNVMEMLNMPIKGGFLLFRRPTMSILRNSSGRLVSKKRLLKESGVCYFRPRFAFFSRGLCLEG